MFIPSSYTCPHCGTKTVAQIHRVIETELEPFDVYKYVKNNPGYADRNVTLEDVAKVYDPDFICITHCLDCGKPVLWREGGIVWPTPKGIAPVEEMPAAAKEFFEEAQSILYLSPRSACVLLRLSLEKICDELKVEPGNLFTRIEKLPLSPRLKQLFHICRKIGNEGAHGSVFDFSITNPEALELAQASSSFINRLTSEIFTTEKELAYYEGRIDEIKKLGS